MAKVKRYKLTDADITYIRMTYAEKTKTIRELAKELGISSEWCGRIARHVGNSASTYKDPAATVTAKKRRYTTIEKRKFFFSLVQQGVYQLVDDVLYRVTADAPTGHAGYGTSAKLVRYDDCVIARKYVVWFLHTGKMINDNEKIISLNGDNADCRIENLKVVTHIEAKKSVFTEDEIRTYRHLWGTNQLGATDIVTKHGVTHATAFNMLTGRTFKMIEMPQEAIDRTRVYSENHSPRDEATVMAIREMARDTKARVSAIARKFNITAVACSDIIRGISHKELPVYTNNIKTASRDPMAIREFVFDQVKLGLYALTTDGKDDIWRTDKPGQKRLISPTINCFGYKIQRKYIVWFLVHGTIPKVNERVLCKDGNNYNCTRDNLVLVDTPSNRLSVFTSKQVILLRAAYANGEISVRDVCEEYEIDASVVSNMLQGITYKHIPVAETIVRNTRRFITN